MNNKLLIHLFEVFITSLGAGLTTSVGLSTLIHDRNWIDAAFAFVVPFLFTLASGLRNLYKDKPTND